MSVLRPATARDLDAISDLLGRCYPVLLAADYPADLLAEALPAMTRAQPALVATGTYHVIDDGVHLLAAGGWTRMAPGGDAVTPGTGHIRHLAVDPTQARRGLGRRLMSHVLAEAASAGMVRLDCLSTRTAVPFYRSLGFVVRGPVAVSMGAGLSFPSVAMTRP